jgi:hypothetical protein
MLRQIGLAIGIAVLIAVLGVPHTPAATLDVYQNATWIVAALALVAGIVGLALLAPARAARASGTVVAAET